MASPKEIHDELLKSQPDSAKHIPEECALCNEELNQPKITEGGDMKTYTEEEFTTAVKEAVAPLQEAANARVAEMEAELNELKAKKADEEVAGQIAEVRIELDKAELRATKAEEKYNELVAFLEAEAQRKEELAAREARKEDIRKTVKEITGFSDERIEASLDRWADMSDEVFEAVLEDFKTIAAEVKPAEEAELAEVPAETAISAVRNETKKSVTDIARAVFSSRHDGIDVRKF